MTNHLGWVGQVFIRKEELQKFTARVGEFIGMAIIIGLGFMAEWQVTRCLKKS